ncbi:MAG TPA: LuxR C-terminal-related transcriptional regulator [Gemmatimonadaceae bacterium]|nr:LuxR C-terminal-related transcriptional regulator [Gemmatimonadaceae bacterium]
MEGGIALLIYVFTTLLVGVACLGALLVLARRRADDLERAFLLFYAALSILVIGRLLLAFVLTVPGEPSAARFAMEYVESFVGRYGVMFALPYLAHRVFAVRSGTRNRVLLAIILLALAGQHVTEFGLSGRFDQAGDVAEDVLFAGVVAYTLMLGFRHLNDRGVYRPFAVRFLFMLVIGLPAVAFDLFLSDETAWRFYPLLYCVLSVVLTRALIARRFSVEGVIPAEWALSPREEEVAVLVGRGLSSREIARELAISTNTVKTHLRAIFDKSGFRTRIGLIAALAAGKPAR